jgi:hypothetical protein
MERWRKQLFIIWSVVALIGIFFYFLQWRFVIPGYRFPYHGMPSLAAACMALLFGTLGSIYNWHQPKANWPWLVAIALIVIQVGFLIFFLQGPDTAVGEGTSDGPIGEAPIVLEFDITPRWGAYAALAASCVSLVLAVLSLLANRRRAKPIGPLNSSIESAF